MEIPKLNFTISVVEIDECFSQGYTPHALIALLSPQFPNLYEGDAGVWEGYTVGMHTTMVLHQFEKYFGPHPFFLTMSRNRFRLFLALHDIGKPIAIAREGKSAQHKYTWNMMEKFYRHLRVEQRCVDISSALLYDDPIGAYLRNRRSKEESERLLRRRAREARLSIQEYLRLLLIYYKVDAGSYTANAGGKPSLDALFDFDEETPELRLAADVQKKIDLLRL